MDIDMNEILEFGEDAVTDVDSKLKILKFSYSWADAVEEHERLMEAQKQQEEMERVLNKETTGEQTKNKNNDNIREETVLDFGDEPVRDWRTKLQILKFDYSWAERVEEEEKKTKIANAVGQRTSMKRNRLEQTRRREQKDNLRYEAKKLTNTSAKRRNYSRKIKQEAVKPTSTEQRKNEKKYYKKDLPKEGQQNIKSRLTEKQSSPERMKLEDLVIAHTQVSEENKSAELGLAVTCKQHEQALKKKKKSEKLGISDTQVPPKEKKSTELGLADTQVIPQGKKATELGIADTQVLPEQNTSTELGLADTQVIPQGKKATELGIADTQVLPERNTSTELGLADTQVIPQGKKATELGIADTQVLPEQNTSTELRLADTQVIPQGKKATELGLANTLVLKEEEKLTELELADTQVIPEGKKATELGIADTQVIPEGKKTTELGIADTQVLSNQNTSTELGLAVAQVLKEGKKAAELKSADTHVLAKENKSTELGLADTQVLQMENISAELEIAHTCTHVFEEKRNTVVLGLALKQSSSNIADPGITQTPSEEKRETYPESNELLLKQVHPENESASTQEAEENKEVVVKQEVNKERMVTDPESPEMSRKQETPINRKITIIRKLLKEDIANEDHGDDDDDDGLFGPRKLFLFDVDYFKGAEKSLW